MKRKLRKKLKKMNKTGGFTLIEMLITVAIIGIVVGIAVPALNTAKADAQKRKIEATEAAIATAAKRRMLKPDFNKYGQDITFQDIQEFLLINGRKPGNVQDLAIGTGRRINPSLTNLGRFAFRNGTMAPGMNNTMIRINWQTANGGPIP
jgi:prepilin-type N-terminal cleavage/methylation domain-containing protein